MKSVICILITFIVAHSIYCQNVIKYDFLKGSLKGTRTVKNGEYVKFTIKDINTFLYSPSIETESDSYNTAVPNGFKNYLITVPSVTLNKIQIEAANPTPFEAFFIQLDTFKQNITKYQKLLLALYSDGKPFTEISKEKETLIKENIIQNCYDNISKINKAYNEFLLLSDSDEAQKKLLDESYTYLKNKNYENFPEDFTILLNKINVNNFTVSSSQIKADKDFINFKITVNPIDNDVVKKYGVARRKEKFNYSLEVLEGFKIDFSSGVYATNVINYKYITFKESGKYKVLRNDEGNLNLGLAALGHIYWRCFENINLGLNIGAGVSNDEIVHYFLGGSIMLGKKQRVVLNGGATIGRVNRLSDLIEENKQYDELPVEDFNIKTYKPGWYFSISYNF